MWERSSMARVLPASYRHFETRPLSATWNARHPARIEEGSWVPGIREIGLQQRPGPDPHYPLGQRLFRRLSRVPWVALTAIRQLLWKLYRVLDLRRAAPSVMTYLGHPIEPSSAAILHVPPWQSERGRLSSSAPCTPWFLHRPLAIAFATQGLPLRVLAPHLRRVRHRPAISLSGWLMRTRVLAPAVATATKGLQPALTIPARSQSSGPSTARQMMACDQFHCTLAISQSRIGCPSWKMPGRKSRHGTRRSPS
jgi:hypothetical protein